jgi:hypothetical protein
VKGGSRAGRGRLEFPTRKPTPFDAPSSYRGDVGLMHEHNFIEERLADRARFGPVWNQAHAVRPRSRPRRRHIQCPGGTSAPRPFGTKENSVSTCQRHCRSYLGESLSSFLCSPAVIFLLNRELGNGVPSFRAPDLINLEREYPTWVSRDAILFG